MESCLLPVDGAFETGASVEVEDDGQEGNWANGKWVGGVGCLGEASDGCKVGSGWPGGISSLNGSVEVG